MPSYPFNPQGASGTNNINGEAQALAPQANQKYNYLIPIYGPFFLDSLTVSITPTAQSVGNLVLGSPVQLTLGVDYFPGLQFVDATVKCGKPIFGAICFTDPELAGNVLISYLTLGGSWVVTRGQQQALIAAQAINPRVSYWEDAFQVTTVFPTYQFSYAEQQMSGFDLITSGLNDIAAVLSTGTPLASPVSFNDHINDFDNPHRDTAATFNLDQVPNWRAATTTEAAAGAAFNLFVTPAGAAAALQSVAVTPFATTILYGLAELNLGAIHDDTDNSKALTTAGLLAMKQSTGDNAIKALFSYERQIVYFSPFPVPYPVTCLGTQCRNFLDLVSVVQTHLSLDPVQGSAQRGCVYLPHDMPTPDLTCIPL